MLSSALVVTAALAGLAGSWSPCGLSMVETLAAGGRRQALVGSAAFAVGALGGGAVTFGGLALLGTSLGGTAVALAIAALVAAALGDAGGRRIVPQVRRQVPESWRRILPVPLAAGLYGVLLGLGFTTFVLSFATWGLAAACLAVGTPSTGLAVGLAFGAGRALPIALLAPRTGGAAAVAERPDVLRGLRGLAAAGLISAAVLLVAAPPAARAAPAVLAFDASDPSASGGLVAYQPSEGPGLLERDGQVVALPGRHPAVSGNLVAWVAGGGIEVADATTLQVLAMIPAPGADAVGLSDSHVAWRAGNSIFARALAAGDVTTVVTARRRGSVGRPVVDGSRVVFDDQAPTISRILLKNLATGDLTSLRRATRALLLAPTMVDGRLMYVRSTAQRQQVLLGGAEIYATTPTARRDEGHEKGKRDHRQGYPRGRRPRKPARPPAGLTVTLWNTAFAGSTAYVTRLQHRGGLTKSRILRIGL